jgi:MFS family permease
LKSSYIASNIFNKTFGHIYNISMLKMLILFALVVLNLVMFIKSGSLINAIGIISPYLASYFHSFDPQIRNSDVLTTATFASLFDTFFGPFMSYLTFHFAESKILISGVIIGSIVYFLCTLITNAYLYFVIFGFNLGIMSNILGFLPAWIAFKSVGGSNKGIAIGVSTAAYALGPFVYGTVFSLMSNPMNELATALEGGEVLFSKEVYENVPNAGRWVTAIIAITCLLSSILLYREGKTTNDKKEERKMYPIDLLKQSTFWYLFWFMFFRTFYYNFLLNCYKVMGLFYLKNEYDLSIISTIAFVFAAAFRIVGGNLYDRYDWTKLNVLYILIEMLLNLTMPLVVENLYLFGIWITCGFAISGLSFMGVWILSERIYSNASWVITYVSVATVFVMLSINAYFKFVITVNTT